MGEIAQIVGIGIVATILVVLIKQQKPELALQLSIVAGIIIFLFVIDKIAAVVTVFQNLATKANINLMYINTILKIIGIAYITEFGAQICRDAGESAIANKVEFAGKVLILILAIPILMVILDTLIKLLP